MKQTMGKNLRSCDKIIKLILEGFAKRQFYVDGAKRLGNDLRFQDVLHMDIANLGDEIEWRFTELTKDIQDESIKEKILSAMIKYMIWKLSKPLSKERREQLVEKYGKNFFGSDSDQSSGSGENNQASGDQNKNENKEIGNIKKKVFDTISIVAHEIIHEILHKGSVEYFEKQNLRLNRDLEIEYIYDFLEVLATMFDYNHNWHSDKSLWDDFQEKMEDIFNGWLVKNNFFGKLNFRDEYYRFVNVFYKLGNFARMNNIFNKFWKAYVKPYMLETVQKYEFKRNVMNILDFIDSEYSLKNGLRDPNALRENLYSYITSELLKNLKEAYKERYVLTVDILSKAKEVLHELREIYFYKDTIIGIIKKTILEEHGLALEQK